MTSSVVTACQLPFTPASEFCQAIVFEVAGYCLALPLAAIAKITLIPPTLEDGMQTGEFVYWGNQSTTLLDLYPCLTRLKTGQSKKLPPSLTSRKFLVIVRIEADLYAIPVDKPPTMIDFNLAEVRSLPPSYPKAVRSIANHVLTLSTKKEAAHIFLLNVQQAVAILSQ